MNLRNVTYRKAAHKMVQCLKDKTLRWNNFDKTVCPEIEGKETLFAEFLEWYYCEEELYLVRAKITRGDVRFIKANSPLQALKNYIIEVDEEIRSRFNE